MDIALQMSRSKEEAEVILRLDFLTKTGYLSVCQWPAQAKRAQKRLGNPVKVSRNAEGDVTVAFWEVPMTKIPLPSVRKSVTVTRATRTLSEEQKKAMQAGRKPRNASLPQMAL